MKKLLGTEVTDEEFDCLICEHANGKLLKVVDDKVVAVDYVLTEEEIKINRIAELKSLLQNTDYKALKYAEGVISAIDYLPTQRERQAWRDEINELENLTK